MKPTLFQAPIETQRIGAGWVSGLIDSGGRFIAPVPQPPAETASEAFFAAVQRAPEGCIAG